jgi:uncharacterized protein (DUF362 family)
MAVRAGKKKKASPQSRSKQVRKAHVVIVRTASNDKFSLLGIALERAGFWPHIDAARRRAGIPGEGFQVLIKPDLHLFGTAESTGTDPELVEHLIDLLHDRGYSKVVVADARSVWELWLENCDVPVRAELVGYHYVTRRGRAYDVADLSEDVVPVSFPATSALRGTGIARAWVEAHYRINFAKNKTHEEFGFALCLQNLLGVLPLRDKDYHYRNRLKPWDVCAEVLVRSPAQFNLVDAFISNHGSEGDRASHPIETRTMIAGPDALLVDWAASLKMGLDPYASAISAKALRAVGLPKEYEILGDLTPYPGWINVPPLLSDSVRRRNESPAFGRLVKPWLQSVNRELFPFKDLVNDRANAIAMKYLSNVDTNNGGFYTLVGLNYLLGFAHSSLEAYQIVNHKERLRWRDAPLDFDPKAFAAADYKAVRAYMEPLQRIIRETPAEPNGLRWRYLDGSVLFEFAQVIPVPFRKFVSRVTIAKAVQSMNDYIGGACAPVAFDRSGRVTYQVERNIYLPQPNWIGLFGGQHIDVGKLEYIEYGKGVQKIFWRAIRSSNGSAEFDDGIVTFAAEEKDQTRVTIVARQKFALPLFWQAINMDLTPKIKNALVVDAYTRYFRQTIANFEAQYQGREFRVGRPWNLAEGETGSGANARLEAIVELFSSVGKALGGNLVDFPSLLQSLGIAKKETPAAAVDDQGFRHFDGSLGGPQAVRDGAGLAGFFKNARTEASGFFTDVAEAMRKDAQIGAAQLPQGECGAP